MNWYPVRATPSPDEREALIAALFELGSQGVVEEGSDLVTWYPEELPRENVIATITAAGYSGSLSVGDPQPAPEPSTLHGSFEPRVVGALTVIPAATDVESPRDIAPGAILVEPGMAFGTGEHPSTRGVLELMQRYVQPGDTVADLGSGSAILSIAAVRLGAHRVYAIESDPDAQGNAMVNLKLNRVEDYVLALEGRAEALLPVVGPVRIITANIVSSVLLSLLPTIASGLLQGGVAIFSGMLLEEEGSFADGLAAAGWRVLERLHTDGWYTVAAAPG